uniref:hypothetical protein n=1 Tax=Klebsiella variicola TaxID=244366 RepID=UPI0035B5251A
MTIIDANHYLEQLLSPAELDRIARDCQFCLRKRAITPAMLVTALLRSSPRRSLSFKTGIAVG